MSIKMNIRKGFTNKRGALALQYVFLIFIATIAVFVIVGLLTRWSFSAENFMQSITGNNEEDVPADVQTINTTDCNDFKHEIVKGARLCYENGMLGRIKGSLCYGIIGPKDCNFDSKTIKEAVEDVGVNVTVNYDKSEKALISYDYDTKRVIIS